MIAERERLRKEHTKILVSIANCFFRDQIFDLAILFSVTIFRHCGLRGSWRFAEWPSLHFKLQCEDGGLGKCMARG